MHIQYPIINIMDTKQNSFIDFITNFLLNITGYTNNPIVIQYCAILQINLSKLTNIHNPSYVSEAKLAAKKMLQYPTVTYNLQKYITNDINNISFLEKYSDEQIKYITYLDTSDSKLIACAGSGKTRSIIGRIKFLVEFNLAKKEEVFAITFSKHAATDFHNKIKDLFPDYVNFCNLKNFSTIDSLAKAFLCRVKTHKSANVEILSIAFRNYLKNITETEIQILKSIKNIKYLFIDEAQDLNEVQYDLIILLKKYFDTKIYLIGDPNQNIYQFRRSSSTYLLNFQAVIFELTKNFRSTTQIIDFSESIKPIKTSKSTSATSKSGHSVVILTKHIKDIHTLILHFIKTYEKKKDLSNIAIICPTRGIGSYGSVGLSVFFNFFKLHKIPFNQLYDESGFNDERKKHVGRIPGHINLITYHGTKGLEFDVVFVMDFYQFLFNIKPTVEEHAINQYLLYVAASRAISIMFVCTYTNIHEGYLNHWIINVPKPSYCSDRSLKIPQLSFRDADIKPLINGVTELIGEMNDEQLNTIHDIIKVRVDDKFFSRRIYRDFSRIDRGTDETLFGIFCEELFYLQHHLARNMAPRKMAMIQMIIDSKFVIIDTDIDFKLLKSYIGPNKLDWETFDIRKNTLPKQITDLIEHYFNRSRNLTDYIVCTTEFIKIIEMNITDIKSSYEKYLNPVSYQSNYKNILVEFFYLIVVQYAYDINHYFYISNHGREKQDLLIKGADLFVEINKYVSNNYLATKLDIKVNVQYGKLMMIGEIDFIEVCIFGNVEYKTIVEIKCVKEISIKYYVQLLLYNFCYYHKSDPEKIYHNKYKIVNLLTGIEHYIFIDITPENMFNLLIMLADIGNLTFSNLNLVYDLETTNLIKQIGPLNHKPIIPRSEIYYKNNKYYGKIFPEIIEIAIKDYDTGMILINTLVKPTSPILTAAQILTKITIDMLDTKPSLEMVRSTLKSKTTKFSNCIMMAHGGNLFDNCIMVHDKLVDGTKISFIDTINIIPLHLPTGKKLESKNLGDIYLALFGEKFIEHRAMEDVVALVRIMKFLNIEF